MLSLSATRVRSSIGKSYAETWGGVNSALQGSGVGVNSALQRGVWDGIQKAMQGPQGFGPFQGDLKAIYGHYGAIFGDFGDLWPFKGGFELFGGI